ncbi:MAG TPA: GNAT family N-acetyltransferase [Afifellaceae bacterium]|nr:GNAT family N-acetyltransferase [Afifellaceae bacterium]
MNAIAMSPARRATPLADAIRPDAAERVYATLTLAFAADPPCRWMFPDPAQYLRDFPAFARAFGGAALAAGTARASDGAAALWLAPGAEPDEEALVAVVEERVEDRLRSEAFAVFAEMGRLHPQEPHWYLPLIGVEPALQGRGLGAALIRPVLEQCDAAGLPAYLEASSPRNRPLYERLGFERGATIAGGGCPPIAAMLRRPH